MEQSKKKKKHASNLLTVGHFNKTISQNETT